MIQVSDKKLKIVLVQPAKDGDVESMFTFHKHSSVGRRPPLGILSLATYLIKSGFRDAQCLEAQGDDLSIEQAAELIVDMKPDVVGLTAWTDFWYPAWRTIQLTREYLPNCRIVVGGPHTLVYAKETLEHSDADFVVAGDGEDTLLELVTCIETGTPIGDLPGLWRQQGEKTIGPTTRYAIVKDLDKLPHPDRTLLPYRKYNSVLNPREYETTMVTSRGCPFKCVFCKMHAQKVYARSAESVVNEFREIADMGMSDVQVYDDTFTWSKNRVHDICNGLIDSRIKMRWAIRDRVNRCDRETYALMRKAGCYRVHFGVESGSPRILEASGKAITLEEAEEALRMAKELGFDTMAFYLFGFLDETYEDAMKTIRFAIRTKADYATFSILMPYPGTSLYDEALRRGIIPHDHWIEFARKPEPNYRIPYVIEQHMDRQTLLNVKSKAMRMFYLRPRTIFREMLNLQSWRELRQKGRMATNIVVDVLRPASHISSPAGTRGWR